MGVKFETDANVDRRGVEMEKDTRCLPADDSSATSVFFRLLPTRHGSSTDRYEIKANISRNRLFGVRDYYFV